MTSGAAIPFTPPHYSLNRVRVVDLPGVEVDTGVAGKTAVELVPVKALVRYAQERADELALPGELRDDGIAVRWELPRLINRLLTEGAGAPRQAAEALVARIGRNLGHVLLALHRGDGVNRDARPDWGDAEWARWGAVRNVWLAGGLASQPIGAAIARHASDWLDSVGHGGILAIRPSPHASGTALTGAARYLPPDSGACLVCDFGQTSVKRSLFVVKGQDVAQRMPLPQALARHAWGAIDDPRREGELHKQFIVDTVLDALREARKRGLLGGGSLGEIMLSVASYVNGGELIGPGAYATISHLTPDARPLLAAAIAERTGQPCRIHLIHDGTAAAAVFAGQPDTAVISLGSALGVGFPPASADDLLRITDLTDTR